MMRRINWQREVGERRRMVEMVEGEETETRGVFESQSWKTNDGNWRGCGGEVE